MKITKPGVTAEAAAAAPGAETAATAAPAAATIADRFKLDAPAAKPKSSGGVGSLVALLAALVALGVAGILVFTMYGHWEFLKGA